MFMLKLRKILPALIEKTEIIGKIPLRKFNVSQINFKGRPLSWKLPSIYEELQPKKVYDFFESIQQINCVSFDDVKKKEFKIFLDIVQSKIIHQMTGHEISRVLIAVLNNNSLKHHEINGHIVKALMCKIEDVSFHQLAFLDYLIQRSQSMELYGLVRSKIKEIYLSKPDMVFRDFNDFRKFKHVIKYTELNVDIVSYKMLTIFAKSLMRIRNNNFGIDETMRVIIIFSQFDDLGDETFDALNKMVNLWYECKPQSRNIELLLSLLVNSKNTNVLMMAQTNLFQLIFERLEEISAAKDRNEKMSISCFEHLINLGYWQQSIDLMSKLFEMGIFNSNVQFFITFYIACKSNVYKPENWESSIMPAFAAFDFKKYIEERPNFDWPLFALQLSSDGHTNSGLIECVLNSEMFKDSKHLYILKNIQKKKSSAR